MGDGGMREVNVWGGGLMPSSAVHRDFFECLQKAGRSLRSGGDRPRLLDSQGHVVRQHDINEELLLGGDSSVDVQTGLPS